MTTEVFHPGVIEQQPELLPFRLYFQSMTDKKITTRLATAMDNILLAEMGARTFEDTYAKDNTPEDIAAYQAASFSPEIQAGKLADPSTAFIIADADGTPAGYAQLNFKGAPVEITGRQAVEIERIYSDKLWIGQGVGAALMRACLALATEKGCDVIWLGVWEHNSRAIAFYTKWGFKIVGSHVFVLGRDVQNDYLMQRKVKES
jgi:GNAT superfamily N-acetyltransferase